MLAVRILGGVYLSSIEPLNNQEDLKKEYGISDILSVIPGDIKEQYKTAYKWKQIAITDEETTNLLPHLDETFEFIDHAASQGRKVLVHCSQGVSRSVAVIMAYLMKKHKLTVEQTLHAVQRKSPEASPNPAFMEQLKLYESMNCKLDLDNETYKEYLKSLSLKIDPTGSALREATMNKVFVDPDAAVNKSTYTLRCRKCRQVLATESEIEEHQPPEAESRQSKFIKTAPNSRRIISVEEASNDCSHYFFSEPVNWMRNELEKGEIEGKFQCPKCTTKVGGYSWKGSRCSCGKWMIPALHLQNAKLDKILCST